MELDDHVCLCFHVSKRKVLNFIRIHEPRVPSQLAECGGAGTGCGWCIPFLKRYFENAKADAAADDALSAEEYAMQRGEYIHAGKGTPPPGATPPPSPISDED
jgi:bacterioferritin-associated ferredoxin